MLLAALLLSLWSLVPSDSTSQAHVHAVGGFDAVTGISEEDGYAAYLNRHLAVDRPIETVRIEGEDFIETLGEGFEIVKQLEGLDGQAVVTPEAGTISWDVSIEQSGMYNIKIHYFPLEGKSSSIEREFKINGEVPFKGAEILLFDRIWGNRYDEIQKDDRDNDLRPRQVEKPTWQVSDFKDRNGYFEESYSFFLNKGIQKLSLTSLREPMAIDYI